MLFTIGFNIGKKPVCLYIGESMAKAEYAAAVGVESRAYHHVDIRRGGIPDRIFEHESENYERNKTTI
jgi:hypothetical protein